MKIYFFASYVDEVSQKISDYLSSSGVAVLSNQDQFSNANKTEMSLEKMQAVIIYGEDAASAGYVVAAALSQKKPVCYLLPKGLKFPEELRYLQNNRQLGDLFFLQQLDKSKIVDAVYDFLEMLETGELRQENVKIKFTFRLSPRLERYLNWKSSKEKISKADWLRKFLIEKVIGQDQEWQKYIKGKNKNHQENE